MIELPADLAEVLKTVQSNENGADIAFPDGDEELLAELGAAWDKWNEVAESHVRAITEAAQRAMGSMSGPAAESFQQYLEKFAGGDGSHVATTLQSGQVMASSLHGAAQAVSGTKSEMVRELQYAKEYMEQNPAGKHDDIAQSEGIKQAAAVYHQYIGQVGNGVDGMLRKSADHITEMTGMGQTCALNGSGASGGPGVAGAGNTMQIGTDRTLPNGMLAPGATSPGATLDGASALAGAAGAPTPFSMPNAPDATGGFGGAGGGAGGAGSFGGSGSTMGAFGGAGGAGSFDGGAGGSFGGTGGGAGGGSGGGSGLAPFSMPAPNLPSFGSDGGPGGDAPVFKPLSTGSGVGSLNLAGLGDLGTGTTIPGSSFTPSTGLGGNLGSGLSGGIGGNPLGSLSSSLGSTLGALGGAGSTTARGGLSPFGGTGSSPFGLGGAGGASARGGLGGAGGGVGGGSGLRGSGGGVGAGGSTLASRAGGVGAGAGMAGTAGSGLGRAGGSGLAGGAASGRGGATGAAGMAGGHGPGMGGAGHGGGRGKEGRAGNRFLSPTRFGEEGEEDEELYGDAGILGRAADVDPRDRHWQRARRRWLDDARADGTFTLPEPATAPVAAAGPTSEQETLSQLAGVLLGTGGGASADTDTGSTSTDGSPTTTPATPTTPAIDLTARQEAVAPTAESTDDAYLDRSRSAAARRGHPDAPEAAAAPAEAAGATGAAGAAPQRAPLREEGGYQVPSPFLRAALSRLAAPAAD
ncbi:hypothetical protein [Streptomyces sp. TLI_171]|uniref:WXG100-like domain-containing protein n=1 Tax=Streptomyces sp. TLI_171 TaxID=1938859 RepID=UPI000C199141|nr:hypothetical protein [Streptomyces sp. TLI_171]RKE22228.1 hypothetical protein BX266_5667 [Streptomyces sp. TLI_171]